MSGAASAEAIPFGMGTMNRASARTKSAELVTTFADQAVIAIENARLFEEVQARTSELSQSVDELRVLGEVSQAVMVVLNTIVA